MREQVVAALTPTEHFLHLASQTDTPLMQAFTASLLKSQLDGAFTRHSASQLCFRVDQGREYRLERLEALDGAVTYMFGLGARVNLAIIRSSDKSSLFVTPDPTSPAGISIFDLLNKALATKPVRVQPAGAPEFKD